MNSRYTNTLRLLLITFSIFASVRSSADKKILKYCLEGSPSSLYSAHASDGPSVISVFSTVYDSLIRLETTTGKYSPALAEKWEISKDGKLYTLHLRHNVSFHSMGAFHPSRFFNAEDVLFSLNRQREANHPFHGIGGAHYPYFQSQNFGDLIRDIRAPDAYTVVIELAHPLNSFAMQLGGYWAVIQSAEYAQYLQKLGRAEELDHIPVGTGPFRFKEYVKDSLLRFETFENYWQGRRKLDGLIIPIVTDSSVRVQKLKAGECDLITMPPMNEVASLKLDPNLRVDETLGSNLSLLAFNTKKPQFQDLRVRQAINLALDKSKYITAVYLGNAVIANSVLPEKYYAIKRPPVAMNLEAAKKLLAEAGYPNGFKTTLWYPPITRPYMPNGKQLAVMIQSDLRKIGVETELVTYDWPTFWSKLTTGDGEHDMAIGGWNGLTSNGDSFFTPLLSCAGSRGGTNIAKLCDPKLQDLIDFARTTTEVKKLPATYQKMEKRVAETMPWAPIANVTVFNVRSKRVLGNIVDPTGFTTFYKLDLE